LNIVIVAIVPWSYRRVDRTCPKEFDFLGELVLYRNSWSGSGGSAPHELVADLERPATYLRTGAAGIGDDGAIEMGGDLRREREVHPFRQEEGHLPTADAAGRSS